MLSLSLLALVALALAQPSPGADREKLGVPAWERRGRLGPVAPLGSSTVNCEACASRHLSTDCV